MCDEQFQRRILNELCDIKTTLALAEVRTQESDRTVRGVSTSLQNVCDELQLQR